MMRDENVFEQLFAQNLEFMEYAHHPSDGILRAYLENRLRRTWRDPESHWAGLQSGQLNDWTHQELSAHVLTCTRCHQRVYLFEAELPKRRTPWAALQGLIAGLPDRVKAVPRPALVTIAVQAFLIVGLVGMLFFQPPPFFPAAATRGGATAAVEPATQSQMQTRQTAEETPSLQMSNILPALVTQALQTLRGDPNPENRLAAVQHIQQYEDPRLVEPLTQVLEEEKHPQVRQAIVQTLTSIWDRMEIYYITVKRTIQRVRERHGQEFGFFQLRINFNLEDLVRELEGFRVGIGYPYETLCTARPDLTLGHLRRLASDFDGILVIDHSISTGSFRLRLSPTLAGAQTIHQLEEKGIICR